MSDITIDRAVVEQALEALESCHDGDYTTGDVLRQSFDEQAVNAAIVALWAALSQEQEPEPIRHAHQWFRTGGMEPGQMRCIHCGKWGKETFE